MWLQFRSCSDALRPNATSSAQPTASTLFNLHVGRPSCPRIPGLTRRLFRKSWLTPWASRSEIRAAGGGLDSCSWRDRGCNRPAWKSERNWAESWTTTRSIRIWRYTIHVIKKQIRNDHLTVRLKFNYHKI